MIKNKTDPSDVLLDTKGIQFTAIIVTFNEAKYLQSCLKRLAFCNQVIIIDMGSSDESVQIAMLHDAEIYFHHRVRTAEVVRKKAISYAKNDWIILQDPDEIMPANIENVFIKLIEKNSDLAVVYLPWQFYFLGKPLMSTIWGVDRKKAFLFNKKRNKFTSDVHHAFKMQDKFISIEINNREKYSVKHHWNDSYYQLFEKHYRYIKEDGKSRYNHGERFLVSKLIKETIYSLKVNLFDYQGLKCGFVGIFLSIFYTIYTTLSYLSLYWYQRRIRNNYFSE